MSRWFSRIMLVLAVVALAAVAARARQDEPKRVALLVGVDQYKARILADKPLRYAERDATELGSVLKQQRFDRVEILTGASATSNAIEAALRAILKDRAANDLVVIGFSGHGVQMPLRDEQDRLLRDERGNELSEAYFCPANAVLGRPDTMVSLTRLMERLNREGGVNLMLVDACRDDPQEASKKGLRTLSGNELIGRMPNNSVILFSCSAGQRALETEQAGGGHGVFFHHVIEGLRGKAADSEIGEVSWDRLALYLRENVNKKAREWDPEGARGVDASPRTRGLLQNPHMVGNLVATPVLARVDVVRPMPAEGVPKPGPTILAEFITARIGQIELKRIPAGSFLRGSPDDDKDAGTDEMPRHEVRITRSFYLSIYEVPQAQYEAVMGKNPSYFSATGGGKDTVAGQSTAQHPVESVSWLGAVRFCNKLSDREGLRPFYEIDGQNVRVPDWNGTGYRLPTEAEWEYACRANASPPTRYSFGDNAAELDEYAWFGSAFNEGSTHPVGEKKSNGFGLHDMHGNVWEWCWDLYNVSYYTKRSSYIDPSGPETGEARVLRGGSWRYDATDARSASRDGDGALTGRFLYCGFRLARTYR
jgi:formylglycine-generating enzyme required for sulfatase activity